MKICPICGKEPLNKRNKMFCSRACKLKFSEKQHEGTCEICGENIRRRLSEIIRFCSPTCARIGHRKRKDIVCCICKKIFTIHKSDNRKYCSLKCTWKSNVGRKLPPRTPEQQKRMSEAMKKAWKNPNRKKIECVGRTTSGSGYILIRKTEHPRNNQGYVPEHVLKAEEILRRLLDGKEVVHHINEIKSDNRPENLYLFKNTGEHSRYHRLLKHRRIPRITESNLPKLK